MHKGQQFPDDEELSRMTGISNEQQKAVQQSAAKEVAYDPSNLRSFLSDDAKDYRRQHKAHLAHLDLHEAAKHVRVAGDDADYKSHWLGNMQKASDEFAEHTGNPLMTVDSPNCSYCLGSLA
jgi:hypothetical protein